MRAGRDGGDDEHDLYAAEEKAMGPVLVSVLREPDRDGCVLLARTAEVPTCRGMRLILQAFHCKHIPMRRVKKTQVETLFKTELPFGRQTWESVRLTPDVSKALWTYDRCALL